MPPLRSWNRVIAVMALAAAALLAGCASEPQKSDKSATPYVRPPEKPAQAPAPRGAAASQPKPGQVNAAARPGPGGAPGAPAAAAGAGDAIVFYETDDGTPASIQWTKDMTLLAVIRFDEGRILAPTAADLEALAPERAGTAKTLGRPVPIDPATLPAPPPGTRRTVRTLREAAAGLGATNLLIVRFATLQGDRLLEASLHDVASGEVLARYGPSEPSLSIAAAALHRLVK